MVNLVNTGHGGIMKIGGGFYVSGNAQTVTMGLLHDRRKNGRIETLPTVVCLWFGIVIS